MLYCNDLKLCEYINIKLIFSHIKYAKRINLNNIYYYYCQLHILQDNVRTDVFTHLIGGNTYTIHKKK